MADRIKIDLSWRCAAHRITTTGDCPRCDDESIAALEKAQTERPCFPPGPERP